jgi:hypothetical protein
MSSRLLCLRPWRRTPDRPCARTTSTSGWPQTPQWLPLVLLVADALAVGTGRQEPVENADLRLQVEDPLRRLQAHRELFHIERFVQKIVGPGIHALEIELPPGQGRQHDDVRIAEPLVVPHLPAQLGPVNEGHHPVRDQDAGRFDEERGPGIPPVFRRYHFVPQPGQNAFKEAARDHVVFGNEYLHAAVSCCNG